MGNSKSAMSASAVDKALAKVFARQSALSPEQFALTAIGHHGVPSNARVLAFCALQGLLAVGTTSGAIKLFGKDTLEVLLELPSPASQHDTATFAVGVTFLQFTARQRLVAAYSDSSIRIFDLAYPSRPHAELRGSWTTSSIVCVETVQYHPFPFVFIATDDGDIHVLHEDTGCVSSYAITPRDVGVTQSAASHIHDVDPDQVPVVTALAFHPRDATQLLIAYDASPSVFLWDVAKRRVLREFTYVPSRHASAASLTRTGGASSDSIRSASVDDYDTDATAGVNAPQAIAWHASGKRFAVGYARGGLAVFRHDKTHGFYHSVVATTVASAGGSTSSDDTSSSEAAMPIRQLAWICAPPTSKNAHIAGAIVFARGSSTSTSNNTSSSNTFATSALTLVYPPCDISSDDALVALVKNELLAWRVATLPSVNSAEIASFAVASDHVDVSAKLAPLALVVLSGNPLDGCVPCVSVQPLPAFVRFCDNDREDWAWQLERLPSPCAIPPMLQRSALSALAVVDLVHASGALQSDLIATWTPATHDPLFALLASEDFDWPLHGGSVHEPMLAQFLASSRGVVSDEMQALGQSATLLLTGHVDGTVRIWELLAPAERTSRGALQLLHAINVQDILATAETEAPDAHVVAATAEPLAEDATRVTCVVFCADARVLVVGFTTGEFVVLEFGHWKQRRPSSLLESHFGANLTDSSAGFDAVGVNTSNDTANESHETKDSRIASRKHAPGFRTLFRLHIHTQAITHVSLSTAYGYVAVADASGTVSLTHLASQSYKLIVFELSLAGAADDDAGDNDLVTVDSLLMSELVQTTEPLPPLSSSSSSASFAAATPATGKASSKSSPTRLRPLTSSLRTTSSNGNSADSAFVASSREVVPILFVGRGTGRLEMFHVHTGVKIAESLVDRHKASRLVSILMVDADGKRVDIPGRVWSEQGDGIAAMDDSDSNGDDRDKVDPADKAPGNVDSAGADQQPELQDSHAAMVATTNTVDATDEMSARALHVRSPSTELEYTKLLVLSVIREQSAVSTTDNATDVVVVQNEAQLLDATLASCARSTWPRSNVVEVAVPAGSLGLHLYTDIEQHAVVKGFVTDSATAKLLAAKGVRVGHVIAGINGLDVAAYGLHVVCCVLEQLRDREKTIAFAEGVDVDVTTEAAAAATETTSTTMRATVPTGSGGGIGVFNDLLGDGANHTDIDRPRFLLCTCGRSVHVLPAAMPRAAEIAAAGVRELLAQPLASFDARAPIVTTAIVRVPVAARMEHCVVVIDQSNWIYVLSLLSLALVFERECAGTAALDGVGCAVTATGELIVANAFSELARFSVFADETAIESALLARKCIETRLLQPERAGPYSNSSYIGGGAGAVDPRTSPQRKKNSIADAGKMFKKLVTGLKDPVDLHKVFQFAPPPTDADNRAQLLGASAAKAKAAAQTTDKNDSGTKAIGQGLSSTKDALAQAAQHLTERGEKLGDLALKTEQMKQTSEDFYHTMRAFNEKNAAKKWYEF